MGEIVGSVISQYLKKVNYTLMLFGLSADSGFCSDQAI